MAKKIVVAMVALLCVALTLGALGCGNKSSGSSGDPEQVVKDFWAAMKAGDFAKAKTYLASDIADTALEDMDMGDDPMVAAMVEAVMDLMNLKVTGSTINGDTATVDTEMTMPDMDAVGEELMAGLFSSMGDDLANMTEEQMMAEFAKKLPELMKNAPTVTEKEAIPMVKEGGAWKIAASPFEDLDTGF